MKKILVVEDESIIAWDVENLLTTSGYGVLGPIGDLASAVVRACQPDVDGAILETRVGGDDTWCLADVLQSRGVPFFFVSALPCSILPERFRDILCLHKPYRHEELGAGIAARFGGRASAS